MEFLAAHWRLFAVAALFFLGVAARRLEWAGPAQGRWLLNFVLNVGLPPLIFGALASAPLDREHALLPLAAALTMVVGWGAAVLVSRRLGLTRTGEGSMVLCAISLNISLIYPYAALSLSAAAFSQLVLFDMGHAVLVWTLSTTLACLYGGRSDDIPVLLRRSLTAPPLWALVFALVANIWLALPPPLLRGSLLVGQGFVLLVPFAMGLLVTGHALRQRAVAVAVLLRSLFGLFVGLGLVWVLDLEGSAAQVVVLGAAAPIGFVSVVLSARESLDVEMAASAAAVSAFAASFWLPLAMMWMGT